MFIGFIFVGGYIFCCVVENFILFIVEFGGKLLNLFFLDIMNYEFEFIDKCVEGLVFGYFN